MTAIYSPADDKALAHDLDVLVHEGLLTALWIGLDWADEDDECPGPLDDNYGVDDVSDAARAELRKRFADFCETYPGDVAEYLVRYEDHDAGLGALAHDYILTCNGHGAGFWDRGLGHLGDRLTDAAHADGGWDLYVGDDGKLYA